VVGGVHGRQRPRGRAEVHLAGHRRPQRGPQLLPGLPAGLPAPLLPVLPGRRRPPGRRARPAGRARSARAVRSAGPVRRARHALSMPRPGGAAHDPRPPNPEPGREPGPEAGPDLDRAEPGPDPDRTRTGPGPNPDRTRTGTGTLTPTREGLRCGGARPTRAPDVPGAARPRPGSRGSPVTSRELEGILPKAITNSHIVTAS